jgi:hypothetical protein
MERGARRHRPRGIGIIGEPLRGRHCVQMRSLPLIDAARLR